MPDTNQNKLGEEMNGFYWIYLAMLAFLLGYEFVRDREKRRLIYWGACGFLILLFAIQDFSVGYDMGEYMRQWDLIPTLTFREMLGHKFEIGYVLLCFLLERVFTSERVLLLAMAVMILLPYCRCFERETPDPMIALMAFTALGMYLHALIYWRQFAAMAILTFSHRFIRERKILPFLGIVALAMTFHKVAVVYVGLYILYRLPVNKWLLLAGGLCAGVMWAFGGKIIEIGIRWIYPRYTMNPRIVMGGGNLLAAMWAVVLLSYWLLGDRMEEGRVRLPFLMILIGAVIQPVCFAYYNFYRVVLFFRVGLVPMTGILYDALFCRKEGNRALALLGRVSPGMQRGILKVYDRRWFRLLGLIILFGVLAVWYDTEVGDLVYIMAPIGR